MIRSISILLVLTSITYFEFSQENGFESFTGELTIYKSQSTVLVYEDSIISKNDYELKWVKIIGTYGGSRYCCGGKLIKANSEADTLFTNNILLDGMLSPTLQIINQKIEIIGDRYIIEEFKYPESLPTSAFHFVYVLRYYEREK